MKILNKVRYLTELLKDAQIELDQLNRRFISDIYDTNGCKKMDIDLRWLPTGESRVGIGTGNMTIYLSKLITDQVWRHLQIMVDNTNPKNCHKENRTLHLSGEASIKFELLQQENTSYITIAIERFRVFPMSKERAIEVIAHLKLLIDKL